MNANGDESSPRAKVRYIGTFNLFFDVWQINLKREYVFFSKLYMQRCVLSESYARWCIHMVCMGRSRFGGPVSFHSERFTGRGAVGGVVARRIDQLIWR